MTSNNLLFPLLLAGSTVHTVQILKPNNHILVPPIQFDCRQENREDQRGKATALVRRAALSTSYSDRTDSCEMTVVFFSTDGLTIFPCTRIYIQVKQVLRNSVCRNIFRLSGEKCFGLSVLWQIKNVPLRC